MEDALPVRIDGFFTLIFHNNLPSCVNEKSHPYFLHNNFQNPIVIKWILSIDELPECFIRIVAAMHDVFWFRPKREFMDFPFANEEHLDNRVIHVTVI